MIVRYGADRCPRRGDVKIGVHGARDAPRIRPNGAICVTAAFGADVEVDPPHRDALPTNGAPRTRRRHWRSLAARRQWFPVTRMDSPGAMITNSALRSAMCARHRRASPRCRSARARHVEIPRVRPRALDAAARSPTTTTRVAPVLQSARKPEHARQHLPADDAAEIAEIELIVTVRRPNNMNALRTTWLNT
mgnify:CR=1 FL=1